MLTTYIHDLWQQVGLPSVSDISMNERVICDWFLHDGCGIEPAREVLTTAEIYL